MIKTVRLFLFFCFLFGGTNSALSQNTDRIDSAFIKLEKLPPMEKLYLHTDKTTYAAGGTIWLKAYLVSVTGHLPLVGSQFVYVELYDNTATLIKRIKIKNSNDVFAGQINLPQNLQEGNYCLKAYTTWMLNQGDDFLFRKMIRIQNIKSPNYTTSIHFDRKPNKQHATVIFKDKNGEPAARKRIQCTLPLGDNQSKIFYRNTGLDGSINFSLDVDSNMTHQHIDVLVMEDEHQFRKRFDLPLYNEAFDVQFFPEGGNLIHGQAAKVAFKAIGTDGLHRKVAGCILNEKNDTIQRFNSAHNGMGTFLLVPDSLTQYKAIAWLENGQKQIFHFPEVLNAGVSLTVAQLSKQLKVAIKASGSDLPHPYYLIAHSGEKIILKQKVDRLLYSIDKNLLPEGIINFVLIDGYSQAVSSRLVFIHKSDAVELEAKTHKEDYSKREEVVIDLNMGSAAWGTHLSISVTDNEVVKPDSMANNILSCLLLTSDLKGYVEDPNYYFINRNNDAKLHLDNLMLTQGWRRFDINSIMKNPIRPKYYLEMGQTISGKFTRGLIRKSNDTPITAISIDPPLFATTVSDEKGNFLFNGLNFKDSTVFTIQSQKYTAIRQEPAGIIEVEQDSFPAFAKALPVKPLFGITKSTDMTKERLMFDGGMRHFLMDEFVVTAHDKSANYQVKYGLSADVMDEEDIKKKFPISITADKLIKTLPGALVKRDDVYFRGNSIPAEIILDGMMVDLASISDINSEDLESIVKIVDASAALYSLNGGAGGVILIKMKEGGGFKRHVPGIVRVSPLGYQDKMNFYVPKYEVDSIRKAHNYDLRSTIYWNPEVRIDSTGHTQVKFYSADPETNYTYIIEGITKDGDICRTMGTIYRKEE